MQISESSLPKPLRAPWAQAGLWHGFFGRQGGVSQGPFATLNLSYLVGDDRAAVDRNWRIARAAMPPGVAIARLNQVHGATVHIVGANSSGERREGDGLVTAAAGVMLTVLTADCVPMLMADAKRRVVGALHAGWRSTLAGIAAAGVRAMTAAGAAPGDIQAALGPSIGPCCFEVEEQLARQFEHHFPNAGSRFRPGPPGKAYIDLRGLLHDELVRAGLHASATVDIGGCTRCARQEYFSRRAAGGGITGLQASLIGFARQGP